MNSEAIKKYLLNNLPYQKPFIFVDSITEIDEAKIKGNYTFRADEAFYKGHFSEFPVTPGVLLLETMGQIGLVCFGMFLLKIWKTNEKIFPVLSHVTSDFHCKILPGETVTVISEKIYFRNNILKCAISLINSKEETVVTTTAICTFTKSIK